MDTERLDYISKLGFFHSAHEAYMNAQCQKRSRITKEIDNYAEVVECEICGTKRRNLKRHLNTQHNLTTEDYNVYFPHSKVMSDGYRKQMSKNSSAAI